jgi:transcriptional regulator with XRE-family HTH domain
VARAPTASQIQRELGRRIRVARIAAGLTQERAAGLADIDYKRFQRLERGVANPTVRTLARIASALGIDFWLLVGRRPEPR